MEKSEVESLISAIRKEFFAFRNGMIADALRKGGLDQKYIFGLQLPQIKEIAVRCKREISDEEASALAQALWNDKECREARLLACHIMPPDLMTEDKAQEWADEVATREEADILSFRLIRYLPFAYKMAERLAEAEEDLKKYTATAIQRFL